eukprot:1161112-Pelagomonas_calceolata.AAC.14
MPESQIIQSLFETRSYLHVPAEGNRIRRLFFPMLKHVPHSASTPLHAHDALVEASASEACRQLENMTQGRMHVTDNGGLFDPVTKSARHLKSLAMPGTRKGFRLGMGKEGLAKWLRGSNRLF